MDEATASKSLSPIGAVRGSSLRSEKLEAVVVCPPMSTRMSCGRIANKFDLRAWLLYLRAWTFGFAYVVFKTTYVDEGKPLRAAAFYSQKDHFSSAE